MDSKYDNAEPLVWFISDDHKSYNHQGKVPKNGQILPVILIDQNTNEEYKGEYLVETKMNGCIEVFQVQNGNKIKTILKTGINGDSSSSSGSSIQCIDSQESRYTMYLSELFKGHMNIEIVDLVIDRLQNAETEYVTIDTPERLIIPASGELRERTRNRIVLRKTFKKMRVLKDKLYIFKGDIQSGKSQLMIDFCIKLLFIKKSSIIVLQMSGHLIQLVERIRETQKFMNSLAQKIGVEPIELVCTEIAGDFTADKLLTALTDNGKPQLYVCIATDKRFQTFNKQFVEFASQNEQEIMNNYCLFIDEADHVDSFTGAKKGDSLNVLKKYAFLVADVSGTVLDLVGHEDVKPDNLFILKPPPTYRGIPSFTIVRTTEAATYSSRKEHRILAADEALSGIIKTFVDEPLTYCALYKDYHPNILLVNNGRTVQPQLSLVKELKRLYPDLTIMAYVGYGVYMYHHSLPTVPFCINGNKSVVQYGIHRFKNISPSAALLWLKRNGGYQKFHHIVISSGDLAGRSISYACKDNNSDGLPFWHLTHHRLVLPCKTSAPEVMQKCRLCTIFESPVPLKLYVSEKDEAEVIKSYWTQEELIERAKRFPSEEYLNQIMKQIKINRSKLPSGRPLTKDSKLKICKKISKNQNDGGLPLDVYKFDGKLNRERPHIEQLIDTAEENNEVLIQASRETGNMRVVDYSRIENGLEMVKIYKATCEAYEHLVNGYQDQWIPQSKIVDWIAIRKDQYDIAQDTENIKQTIRGSGLHRFYEPSKSDITNNEEAVGMIIKKTEFSNRVFIRIN